MVYMCKWWNGDYTCKNYPIITCVNKKTENTHVEIFCHYMCEWRNGDQTCKNFPIITCVNEKTGNTHVKTKPSLHV